MQDSFQEPKGLPDKTATPKPISERGRPFLYLVISQTAMNSAFTREENRVQRPVYYLSQAFQGAKVKYPRLKKVSFTLIVASRKLCPYF